VSRDRRGAALVLAAAVLWGTTGTARALAPAGTSPLSVRAVRIAVGGLAPAAVARLRGGGLGGGRAACGGWLLGPGQGCDSPILH
jgi:DME family drug/metabolite transporter